MLLTKLHTFNNLRKTERRALFQAYTLLWRVRIGLWLNAPAALKHYQKTPKQTHAIHLTAHRLAQLLELASAYVPQTTCLVKALAGKSLLERSAYPATLHLGVAREKGKLEAHAWLSHNDLILIGYVHDLLRYKPLLKGR